MTTCCETDTIINTTCSICLEYCRQPRILPCKHFYCKKCLHEYIVNWIKFRSPSDNRLECPICRTRIDVPGTTTDINAMVDWFPAYYTQLSHSIPSSNPAERENESTPAKDSVMYCEPCLRDGIEIIPTHFCFDCEERMCIDCTKYHKKLKSSFKHKLSETPAGDYKGKHHEETPAKYSSIISPKCEKHAGKKYKYICKKHDALCCSKCAVIDHGKCMDVIPLADYVKSNEYTTEMKCFAETFAGVHKEIEHSIAHERNYIKTTIRKKDEFHKGFSDLQKSIETQAWSCEDRIRSITNDIVKESRERIQSATDKLPHLQYFEDSLVQVKTQGTTEQHLITVRDIKPRIQLFECQLKDNVVDPFRVSLENTTLQWELKIDFVAESSAKKFVSVNMRAKPILLRDCVVLNCGYAIVSEESNRTIRAVDLAKGIELESILLASEPWGLAKLGSNEVVVTLPNTKQLCSISVRETSPHLSIKKYFDTKTSMFGISAYRKYSSNGLVALSKERGTLMVFELGATNTEEIKLPKKHKHELSILSYVNYILVDKDATQIYFSCFKSHKVVAVNFQGQTKFVYTHSTLKVPMGLALDKYGTIFVCSYETHQVHMISSSGQHIGVCLTTNDGLNGPFAIAFDEKSDRCIVCDNHKGKEIKIFRNVMKKDTIDNS